MHCVSVHMEMEFARSHWLYAFVSQTIVPNKNFLA